MPVKDGDNVKVEYEGRFENGDVFDSSKTHGQPLEFTVGAHHVVKGFEQAVLGMEQGEEKEVTIKPADGYGEVREELKQKVPKDKLPPTDQEIKPGMMLAMQTPDGRQVPVQIAAVDDTTITLDMNHPLAGKTLIFKIKVVEIVETTK